MVFLFLHTVAIPFRYGEVKRKIRITVNVPTTTQNYPRVITTSIIGFENDSKMSAVNAGWQT